MENPRDDTEKRNKYWLSIKFTPVSWPEKVCIDRKFLNGKFCLRINLVRECKKLKKLLTYLVCNNIWSESLLFYHKTYFLRKT